MRSCLHNLKKKKGFQLPKAVQLFFLQNKIYFLDWYAFLYLPSSGCRCTSSGNTADRRVHGNGHFCSCSHADGHGVTLWAVVITRDIQVLKCRCMSLLKLLQICYILLTIWLVIFLVSLCIYPFNGARNINFYFLHTAGQLSLKNKEDYFHSMKKELWIFIIFNEEPL